MDATIKNAPERIYLCLGEGLPGEEIEFHELHEVTWCADKQDANDIEYVLAERPPDAAQAPICWITKEQLGQIEDLTADAWVYWRETGHVAESDEVPLYAAPVPPAAAAPSTQDVQWEAHLTEAVELTIDTLGRQLELIAERAPGGYLDKTPIVRSLTAHKQRLERAMAERNASLTVKVQAQPDKTSAQILMSAAAKSGDPGAIALAAQLAGAAPCEACGFVNWHCRCEQAAAQPDERAAIPEDCDVRKILLRVVPGNGDGHEVYARNVGDVEELLSELGERLEDFESARAAAPQASVKGDERFSPEVMKEVLEALGTMRATWELNGFNDEADKLGVFIDAHK